MSAIQQNRRNPNPKKQRRLSLPEIWFKLQHFHQSQIPISKTLIFDPNDPFSLLSDESLSLILSKIPKSQLFDTSLVCKRWFSIIGKLVCSIVLFDWGFLDSGRLISRFSNLIEINLVPACFRSNLSCGILFSNRFVSINVNCDDLIGKDLILRRDLIDLGLKLIANGCPCLRKIGVVNGSELGLGFLGRKCVTIREVELHCVDDMSLQGICGFKNLEVLKLVGLVDGLYDDCVVTDIGLTLLAQGCRRLMKIELSGCEGSFDGIKAIGQCCQMLEELTLCGHRMDGGWLSALSYCCNLKTLKLQSCESIDSCPGPDEHLGSCLTLEKLYVERCQVRDKAGVKALFLVCETVREISLQDCWGLEDDIFRYAAICRRVKSLSLEGCSLLTIEGFDSVVHSWNDLQTLKVVSCNGIKDSEITPELAMLFSSLKELKWRPDSRSLLKSSLTGTGVGKKGGRFFKKA